MDACPANLPHPYPTQGWWDPKKRPEVLEGHLYTIERRLRAGIRSKPSEAQGQGAGVQRLVQREGAGQMEGDEEVSSDGALAGWLHAEVLGKDWLVSR